MFHIRIFLECQINTKYIVAGCRCVKPYRQDTSWITACSLVLVSKRVCFGIETRLVVVWREHNKRVLSSKVHSHINVGIFYQASAEVVPECYCADLQERCIEITHSVGIFMIVITDRTSRIRIFCTCVRRCPVVNIQIISTTSEHVEITICTMYCTNENATASIKAHKA